MHIIVDTREQKMRRAIAAYFAGYRVNGKRVTVLESKLDPGDAVLCGRYVRFIVERKTTTDLLDSIIDGRLESQLSRLSVVRSNEGPGVVLPLIVVHGPWPRAYEDKTREGRLNIAVGRRKRKMSYWVYPNVQLSIQLSQVPLVHIGNVSYPGYLEQLLKYANKKTHKFTKW